MVVTRMVVIQKREYQINGIIYYQYRLNVPSKIIDLLRWNDTDEIEFVIMDRKLICKISRKKRIGLKLL